MPKPTTVALYPPIPLRQFDWMAYFDEEGLCGYGPTEQAAIDDLMALVEERKDA